MLDCAANAIIELHNGKVCPVIIEGTPTYNKLIAKIANGVLHPTEELKAKVPERRTVSLYLASKLLSYRNEKRIEEGVIENLRTKGAGSFEGASSDLKDNSRLARTLMEIDPEVYPFLGEGPRNEQALAIKALNHNEQFIGCMGKSAVLSCLEDRDVDFSLLSDPLKVDEDIAVAIVGRGSAGFQALSKEMKSNENVQVAYIAILTEEEKEREVALEEIVLNFSLASDAQRACHDLVARALNKDLSNIFKVKFVLGENYILLAGAILRAVTERVRGWF